MDGRAAFAAAIAVTFLLAAQPAASQPVRPEPLRERGAVLPRPVIPPAFRGHWSVDLHDCSRPPVDNAQVWIAAGSLNYYETNGHASRVVLQDGRHAVVTLNSEGEGISFTAKKGLTLSSDRRHLTIRNEDDTGHETYRRCAV